VVKSFENKGLKIYQRPRTIFKKARYEETRGQVCWAYLCNVLGACDIKSYDVHVIVILGM
jgi:hypothetical protein